MIHTVLPVAIALALCAAPASAAPKPAANNPAEAQVAALIDAFNAARFAFDPAALAPMLAPDYVEISPIGEVDPAAKMLGFYAPAERRPAPRLTTDERSVRVTGPLAILTERQSIGEHAVRTVYVARRDAARWRLVSVQYTPIRAPRPPVQPPAATP